VSAALELEYRYGNSKSAGLTTCNQSTCNESADPRPPYPVSASRESAAGVVRGVAMS
jgi:hypothetical protein